MLVSCICLHPVAAANARVTTRAHSKSVPVVRWQLRDASKDEA